MKLFGKEFWVAMVVHAGTAFATVWMLTRAYALG
jgi:hypothetical protein